MPLRKAALLITIPCAIFPILMAAYGMIQPEGEELLFRYDRLFFGIIYLLYGYGLYLSWQVHRKLTPALVFIVHLVAVVLLAIYPRQDWLAYVVLVGLIATSLVNQYYRLGIWGCDDSCYSGEMKKSLN